MTQVGSFVETFEGVQASDQWELDCYSRPVLVEGGKKKLWEALLTDSNGSFRICQTIPSNKVNSKELRGILENYIDQAEVKPRTIRFFRGAMFNMIKIALSDLDVEGKPSRCTFMLAKWLNERNTKVYPMMPGYRPTMANGAPGGLGGLLSSPSALLAIKTPVKMPDALRGEQYAFVQLPLAEFREGGGVTSENVGVGKLCPCDDEDWAADSFVPGVVVFTKRAQALAQWLSGTELVGISCDLRQRVVVMDANIDTRYLMARLDDQQRMEAGIFEESKENLKGLHFISVQKDEDDDPAGFWLLRSLPEGL